MDKKYELTATTITHSGRVLHQIRALKSFGNVTTGDLGGYLEREENLSQLDTAWVSGNTKMYDNVIENLR